MNWDGSSAGNKPSLDRVIVLDTDHLTELGYNTPPGRRLAERIEKASTGDAITIISVQEQMKGLLARIAKAKSFECRRLSKSGFHCLSKSGQEFLIFQAQTS